MERLGLALLHRPPRTPYPTSVGTVFRHCDPGRIAAALDCPRGRPTARAHSEKDDPCSERMPALDRRQGPPGLRQDRTTRRSQEEVIRPPGHERADGGTNPRRPLPEEYLRHTPLHRAGPLAADAAQPTCFCLRSQPPNSDPLPARPRDDAGEHRDAKGREGAIRASMPNLPPDQPAPEVTPLPWSSLPLGSWSRHGHHTGHHHLHCHPGHRGSSTDAHRPAPAAGAPEVRDMPATGAPVEDRTARVVRRASLAHGSRSARRQSRSASATAARRSARSVAS